MNKELKKFVVPEIIVGEDSRLLIGRYLSHFSSKKPLIVTDQNIREFQWFEDILNEIEKFTNAYSIFDGVSENPKDYEAMLGAEVFLSGDCDLIVAIGGGSPMDCAKGIAIVATNGGHILDYEGVDEIKLPGPPLVCIPSTAGTSADVSQFAIICDSNELIKKAIISKKVVPDLALIDPVPLMTMDQNLVACTGMDALTHAIEAYVSNAQSNLTDIHALEAIKLINENLEKAVKEEKDLETMNKLMLASLYAGIAFSNASLGAVHGMAHSLGGLLDLPHGECNSILLEHVINLNYDSVPKRYSDISEKMGIDIKNPETIKKNLLERIRNLRENVGIRSFIEISGSKEDLFTMLVENALEDPCMITNPKDLSAAEVRNIYEGILQEKR
ncbi:MAG: iron-containing alcohol dehydrogenase [Eubacteriales bacterium]|nr:iron-containing alcohol dehydrogenase [Eubacteriales bacterium]